LWVLTSDPPHKQGQSITPVEHRLEMLSAALADRAQFELSCVDIDRPPPHYAVDTVRILREDFPSAKLIYLLGGDSLRDLPTWHTPAEFVSACDGIAVVRRPDADINLEDLETFIPGITPKVQFVEAPLLEIAASQIRQRIRQGDSVRADLPPEVYRIIQIRKLYRSQ